MGALAADSGVNLIPWILKILAKTKAAPNKYRSEIVNSCSITLRFSFEIRLSIQNFESPFLGAHLVVDREVKART